MNKSHVIVLSVIEQGLTKKQAADKYGVSIRWINILLARYRSSGLDGLHPKSRRPGRSPTKTNDEMVQRILSIRFELTEAGMDNGPKSIHWQISQSSQAPSKTTIWRILKAHGAIEEEPKKRPRNSYIRFQADQPNETWQSDFTHWRLADGTDVEILNWLDDHSRYLLSCTVHKPVRGSDVLESFLGAIESHGPPQSTLTDNGLVYTSRFIGGKAPFEYALAERGIKQKNGSPGHPQTQGKIERFHQTLKKYLAQMPKVDSLEQLQQQLNRFQANYNQKRPHSALGQKTPHSAYLATPKAIPREANPDFHRVRIDRVDVSGKVSIRRAGHFHKLGIGRSHSGKAVLILLDNHSIAVTEKLTGELLSEHLIEPEKKYWPKINPQNH